MILSVERKRMHSFYIAWQYLHFNRFKTLTIIACITVILSLPLLLKLLVDEAELQLRSRATSTPLLIGERGSNMDLVLSSLYFTDDAPAVLSMELNQKILETGLAQVVPLYRHFNAEGFPIVGTSIDYFSFRKLGFAAGSEFLHLGDCVLGAEVAAKLGLKVGDNLFSSSENLFDLAGNYPLKMTIAGILKMSHSADDLGVFVDLKTSWIIAGLGHGHADLKTIKDSTVIMQRDSYTIRANAKLIHYNEITVDNRNSFHFHGDMQDYPLSAIIVDPDNDRAAALLKGRFIGADVRQQIVKPANVINVLLERIFQIKKLVDGVTLLISLAALLALVLVFALSMRLRESEFETLFKLGCIRGAIARLLLAEITLVMIASIAFSASLIAIIWPYRGFITHLLIFQ